MVVFNRCIPSVDRMMLHQIVRATSRRTDIIYENDGEVDFDDIEDPLPFDLDAPVVEIADRDYALWYRDAAEDPRKYSGKTVRFKGYIYRGRNIGRDEYVPGRMAMVCCAEDVRFVGFIAKANGLPIPAPKTWQMVTARVQAEERRQYKGVGPVLYVTALEPCEEPEEEVVTFNA